MTEALLVRKSINFNGVEKLTLGRVQSVDGDFYKVSFTHDKIEFAGLWKKSECEVIGGNHDKREAVRQDVT